MHITHTQLNWAAPDLARKHRCVSQLDMCLHFTGRARNVHSERGRISTIEKKKHISVPHLNAAGDGLQQDVVFAWRQKGLWMHIWPFTVESTELSQLCSHPKRGPMIILRHAALSDFLLRWRRLAYVRSSDYFCTLTSHMVHNVTALRGICTKRDKIKGSNIRGLSVGLPAWKMGNCHQGRGESSSNPPGICLL